MIIDLSVLVDCVMALRSPVWESRDESVFDINNLVAEERVDALNAKYPPPGLEAEMLLLNLYVALSPAPAEPCAPVGPVAPVAPVAPVGPVGP